MIVNGISSYVSFLLLLYHILYYLGHIPYYIHRDTKGVYTIRKHKLQQVTLFIV